MWPTPFRKWKKAILLFPSILFFLNASSQEQPVVHDYLPEDYKASPQNWSVSSTGDNVVFGNSSGVLVHDGEHWNTLSLPGNHRVRAVKALNDTIFCGGYGEFGYWTPTATGAYQYQSLNQELDFPLSDREEIWHIESYSGGVLFQSFSTMYLFEHDSVSILSPSFSSGIMFLFRCQDSLYFQVIGAGLAHLQSDQSITSLPHTEELSDVTVTGIETFGDGLLIATDKQGLFTYKKEVLSPAFPQLQQLFSQSQINKFLIDDDRIIIGTILQGVYVIDFSGAILFHFSTESGLPDNTVLSLDASKEGGLWVGLDYGLAYIDLHSPYFKYIDQEGSLGVVFCAAEYGDRLYLGTNHGLFMSRPTEGSGGFEIIEGTQGQVWSLEIGNNGELYCGHNKGTFRVTENTARLVSDITGAWSWLLEDPNGSFLQGTYTGIVLGKSDSLSTSYKRLPGLNAPIRDLVRDQAGYLWGVHPYKGLYRFRLSEDQNTILDLRQSAPEWNLPDMNRLRMMKIEDQIIVRSDSGWFALDQAKLVFSKISDYKGLSLSAESQKLVQSGELVLLLEKEQVSILEEGKVQSFPTTGTLPEDPFAIRLNSGNFLIGTSQGYLVIDPSGIQNGSLPPPFITSISILGKSKMIPYPLQSEKGPSIILKSHEQGINIEFSSGFSTTEQLYRYKIAGKQSNHSEWSVKAGINIPLLPYGETVIRIERKSDGQQLQINCKREFPWYLTQWAVLVFILIAGVFMYLLLRQYQIYLRRKWRKQQIEGERLKHAREIEAKNKQLEHDIEGQNQELAGVTMNLVRKNEIILELKENLKEHQKKPEKTSLRSIILKLNSQLSSEKDWEAFEYHFTRVHQGFFTKLKKDYPGLTSGDLRLAAYLRMNLSSKEIAPLLHISIRSLENKRYRLRKKLLLTPNQQLIDVLLSY